MSSKIAIYTSIFGNYDNIPQISNKPPNCDLICFTENNIELEFLGDVSNNYYLKRILSILNEEFEMENF